MSKIQDKIEQLNKSKFDLGAAIDSKEQNAGSGGQYRRFKNATIYWHPVMGDEAHEVHGGILDKYVELGGSGAYEKTGKRELGFPLSDEIYTRVGNYPVSYFEWGVIIWKDGGLMLSGDFYTTWKSLDSEAGRLGYPISEVTYAASGQAIFFEYGCLWKGSYSKDKIEKIYFGFPKIGNPAFVATNNPLGLKQEIYVQLALGLIPPPKIDFPPSFFNDLFGGRLFLVPTGQAKMKTIKLIFPEQDTKILLTLGQLYFRGQSIANSTELSENTLYDISIKLPSGKIVCLAPHAVYFKNTWTDFGIMHATDIHVTQRHDKFRAKLHELGREDGAQEFNNYNDNFRDLILYANKLHKEGKLDLIILTGDLVDYEFEYLAFKSDDNNERLNSPSLVGDNYYYFEKLIRGQIPYPDGKPNEELLVPILTTLGNHDYRAYKYYLNFEVNLKGIENKKIRNFEPLNLIEQEANDLQGGFKSYAKETSANMVKVDEKLRYYFKRFSDSGSYVVRLGKHQILMMDTRWDKDMLDDSGDAFLHWLGMDSESSKNFADGNPDSKGMNDSQIKMLQNVLNESLGLVIIGIHAPPVNPNGNEYPHYFRETEHRNLKIDFDFDNKAKDDISAYLWRNNREGGMSAGEYIKKHRGWFNSEGATYFYTGENGDDMLDYGIGKDKIKEFLQLCVGVGVERKANLVLCGHIHKRAEFRLGWNKEIQVYFDFYTENPNVYYPSKKLGFDKPVHIEVKEGTPIPSQTKPKIITKNSRWGDYQILQIPPYATPLNKATNKVQWWKEHSPLILQTAAVGPIEANQRLETSDGKKRNYPGPSFQGYRLITIKNDIITDIKYFNITSRVSGTYVEINSDITPPPKKNN